MSTAAISISDLTYYYPNRLALEKVSFSIEKGEVTALVGPNGAGKSTLIRTIAGLDSPYAGKIDICGVDVQENPRLAHTKIGYLSDDFGLYDELSVKDVLVFMGECHSIYGKKLSQRVQEVSTLLRLDDVLKQKCGTLSRGWRQRVGIGMAIIHQPDVLMLDEPASGLDPEARSELSTVLKKLQSHGMTILVSSHILAELEEYCTAMLVLRDGKIQDHIVLKKQQPQEQQTIITQFTSPLSDDEISTIKRIATDNSPTISDDRKSAIFKAPVNQKDHQALLKKLIDNDLQIHSFKLEESSLQSLYLELAQKPD